MFVKQPFRGTVHADNQRLRWLRKRPREKFPIGTTNFSTPPGIAPRRRSPRAIGAHTGGAAAAYANGAAAAETSDHEDKSNDDLSDEARCHSS